MSDSAATKLRKKSRRRIGKVILFVVMVIVAVISLVPFVWMLSSSFKANNEIFIYPIRWIPDPIRLENYIDIWTEINFPRYYINTFVYSTIVTVGQVVTCSMAAFAFAKLHFPGRDKIFMIYLMTMMVPWHAIMIPQFIINRTLGLYNTPWAIILMNLFSAFGIFLLRQFMMSIPNDLFEAARIDGCSEYGNYTRIMLPLCKPGIATLVVFTFTFMWNDYMAPMLYIDSDKYKTIQLGLASLRSLYKTDYGLILAGTVVSMIPIVIIYACAQKYLIEGVTFSGVKG